MDQNFKFDKQKDVEIISEEGLYKGFFKIKKYQLKHRLFSGGWSEPIHREIVERRPVAAALPYDPIFDKVILIQQFRVGALTQGCPWLIEIVAGIADDGDKNAEDIINREIKEESGLEPLRLKKMYEYWVSPGGSTEYLTLYCAMVDSSKAGGVHGLKEEHEDIYVHVLSSNEAFELLAAGKINNAITITALQWLQLHKTELDRFWI